jgi:hypothetical protein
METPHRESGNGWHPSFRKPSTERRRSGPGEFSRRFQIGNGKKGLAGSLLIGMTTIKQTDFPCQEKKCLNSKIMNVIQQMAAKEKLALFSNRRFWYWSYQS